MGKPNEKSIAAEQKSPGNATRSVVITVQNNSSSDLYRVSAGLAHGIWSDGFHPPEMIPAGQTGRFASESQGGATGTEGRAQYFAAAVRGMVNLYWDDPYAGSNEYSVGVPAGLHYSTGGGGGNNADWHVTLTDA